MTSIHVKIDQGELKGKLNFTKNDFKYISFCGIPYAKPPVGNLRFKDPQPADGWTGVRDATQEGAMQCQIDPLFSQNKLVGDEDCLFVNVYVPAGIPPGKKLPVMVWIHGGSFRTGSGNALLYGPDYLIEKNIVYVSLNYRMNILGFLCLNNPEVPGNAGLKDQAMAVKWVKNNIEKFNGDSNNITIFGESAGAASVSYLMMSSMAKGLFNKAIMQSGVSLNSWSLQKRPDETIKAFSEKLGIQPKDKEELLKMLQSTPVDKLLSVGGFSLFDDYNFVPVIEKEFPNVSSFITKSPLEIMMSGDYNKVPIICGQNSQEGVLLTFFQSMSNPKLLSCKTYEESGMDIAKILSIDQIDEKIKSKLVQMIASKYFSPNFFEGYIDFLTDLTFIFGINQAIRIMSKSIEVYFYHFDYHGSLNMYSYICPFKYTSAAHADELAYIFKPDVETLLKVAIPDKPISPIKPTRDDILVVQRFVEMWTNFAKYGNPTPETNQLLPIRWKPATEPEFNCLKISKDLENVENILDDRIKFWSELSKMMN